MQNSHCRRNGFTFIELVIAILVMGIIAGIAAPTYISAMAHYRAEMAARKIVADLQYARSEAQRSSQNRTLNFDTVTNSYSLANVMDIDHSANAYTVSLVDDPFRATLVSASLGGDASVIFDIYGRPDSSGSIVVQAGSIQVTVSLASDGTATRL